MKIDSSSLALSATHHSVTLDEVHESPRAWVGDTRPDFDSLERAGAPAAALPSTRVSISQAARAAGQVVPANAPQDGGEAQAINDAIDSVERDPKLLLIRSLVEMMTGRKIRTVSAESWRAQRDTPAPRAPAPMSSTAPTQRAGFGLEYDRHELHTESEQSTFHAQGTVRTSDGREISFSLDLAMSRSYRQQVDVSIRAGDAVRKDPLVINFNGAAAQLQDQRFSFDLEGDGQAERVPILASGSAYLALDHNNNGQIDNGTELFGTASGNGFADLSAFDRDGNGWIDASDPVFARLRAWTVDSQGGASLRALSDLGVGALSLAHADTPFALQDATHRTLGGVRATGVYLNVNGSAGTLQQIDLIV